jgi:hypothetical protein
MQRFKDVVSYAIVKSLAIRTTKMVDKVAQCTPPPMISASAEKLSTASSCTSCFAYKGLEVCPESLGVQARHFAQIVIDHVVVHAHAP